MYANACARWGIKAKIVLLMTHVQKHTVQYTEANAAGTVNALPTHQGMVDATVFARQDGMANSARAIVLVHAPLQMMGNSAVGKTGVPALIEPFWRKIVSRRHVANASTAISGTIAPETPLARVTTVTRRDAAKPEFVNALQDGPETHASSKQCAHFTETKNVGVMENVSLACANVKRDGSVQVVRGPKVARTTAQVRTTATARARIALACLDGREQTARSRPK